MKKLLLLPVAIFPYVMCVFLACMFWSGEYSTPLVTALGISALGMLALSITCNLIYIFTTKDKSAAELIKTSFIIKLIHIPTYIVIFVLGVILGLMFFMTFPIVLLLIFVDLLTLWLSAMISLYSIVVCLKDKGVCSKPLLIISLICQFFFCADIISMLVLRIKAAKKQ